MIRTPGEEIVRLRELNKSKDQEIKELKKKINKLRTMAWEMDIPYPTIPEYVELHEKMQKIINYIDEEIYEGVEY